jgi:outer membrane protein W
MKRRSRSRYRSLQLCTLVLSGACAVTGVPALAQAQPGPDPTVSDERPMTPNERAERARQAERAKAVDVPPDRVRYQEEHHRPGEFYVGGFGGYTFGGSSFTNAQVFGTPSRGFNLNDSGMYGLKIGYFMPDRMNWLGFEVEGFNTSPNLKPSLGLPGASLRVTTLAFNAIIRGKFACGPSRNEPSRRTTAETHRTTVETQRDVYGQREDTFCPLQPYVGAGIGVFFAHTNGIGGGNSASDNAVPGFNGLAGVRYFMTEHIAIFGEYKYNRATFNFDTVNAAGGLSGDYSVHNAVGGLSFHF